LVDIVVAHENLHSVFPFDRAIAKTDAKTLGPLTYGMQTYWYARHRGRWRPRHASILNIRPLTDTPWLPFARQRRPGEVVPFRQPFRRVSTPPYTIFDAPDIQITTGVTLLCPAVRTKLTIPLQSPFLKSLAQFYRGRRQAPRRRFQRWLLGNLIVSAGCVYRLTAKSYNNLAFGAVAVGGRSEALWRCRSRTSE
jgi:hypothetical protein